MSKKYEIIGTDYTWSVPLYRIKNIQTGELGGLVMNEDTLSQEGDCWIEKNATVFDNARIYGNAQIKGNAMIFDNAQIYGNAIVTDAVKIYDNAQIYDNAIIKGLSEISDNTQIYENAEVDGNIHHNVRIYGNAKIIMAQIYDNVQIYGNANLFRCWVYDNCKIGGNVLFKFVKLYNDLILENSLTLEKCSIYKYDDIAKHLYPNVSDEGIKVLKHLYGYYNRYNHISTKQKYQNSKYNIFIDKDTNEFVFNKYN